MQTIKNQGGKSLVFYLEDESLKKSVISSLLPLSLVLQERPLPEHRLQQLLVLLVLHHLAVLLQEWLQRLPGLQWSQHDLLVRQPQIH